MTLLLTALRDHIAESGWTNETGPTAAEIDDRFLRNAHKHGPDKPKLVLRRNDDETLRKIMSADAEGAFDDPASEIDDAFLVFRELVREVDPATVYKGVTNLEVVDVSLNRQIDNPQLVFESLNSTGLDLSQSDLVRNFILMGLPDSEQVRIYEAYWSKIEAAFSGSENVIDNCIRDYLAFRNKATRQTRSDRIYREFREAIDRFLAMDGGMDETLAGLLQFSRYYAAFMLWSRPEGSAREALLDLRRLVDVPATLVCRLFRCFRELGTLTEQQFVDSLRLIESYVVRRQVCGFQTRGYWSEFAKIAYTLDETNPENSLRLQLARQRESYRFPSDEEFERTLLEDNLYRMRVCRHLLERLENADQNERTNTGLYQIEHVLPQQLTPDWTRMLGDRWRQDHEAWLHRLGNLTLTGYNARYSNLSFERKKSIPGGFDESAVRLNRFVRDEPKWTASEIERRGRVLAKRSLEIWPHHRVSREQIHQSEVDELRIKAAASNLGAVEMTGVARELFNELRTQVLSIEGEVIEIAARKSVSYYCPEFFLEVLPRKTRMLLVLPPEFREIDDPDRVAFENNYKFLVNCEHDGGVLIDLDRSSRIAPAMNVIQQAFHLLDSR